MTQADLTLRPLYGVLNRFWPVQVEYASQAQNCGSLKIAMLLLVESRCTRWVLHAVLAHICCCCSLDLAAEIQSATLSIACEGDLDADHSAIAAGA